MSMLRKTNYKHKISFGLASLLMISQGLIFPAASKAEVTNRANGRCAFIVRNERVFDGHCVMKHKTTDNGNQVVVVKLDNGDKYQLRGRNLNRLKIQAWDGIHDVKHKVDGDKDVFVWRVDGQTNRLITRMDTRHKANVSVDENYDGDAVVGTVIGAVAGALIGSLISGDGGSSNNGGNNSNSGDKPPYGETPRNLRDLVGARAGQAENQLKSRGYSYRNTEAFDGGKITHWRQKDTRYCVEIATVDGRYSAITYTSRDRCEKR